MQLGEGITAHRQDDGVYEIRWRRELALGTVRRGGEEFWSYGRWHIDGDPVGLAQGGVNGKTRKRLGWHSLAAAAAKVSRMASGRIIAFECGRKTDA